MENKEKVEMIIKIDGEEEAKSNNFFASFYQKMGEEEGVTSFCNMRLEDLLMTTASILDNIVNEIGLENAKGCIDNIFEAIEKNELKKKKPGIKNN